MQVQWQSVRCTQMRFHESHTREIPNQEKKKESVRQDFEMKKRKKLLLLFFFFEMSPEKITYEFSMKKHEI